MTGDRHDTVWDAAAFERDALDYLRRSAADHRVRDASGDAFWFAPNRICVTDPRTARDIMSNRDDAYLDHSDFFYSRFGATGPRDAQIRVGHAAREMMNKYLVAHADRLPALVARRMGPISHWPDTGNRILYDHLGNLLLHPRTPASVRRVVDRVVERAVLAGAPERHNGLSRAVFRRFMHRRMGAEIRDRRRRGAEVPMDLLDVVVSGGFNANEAQLVEVFLSFVFALTGSLGFALGWSVYLQGTAPETVAQPAWIVQEALRMWPVAWLFGRWPRRTHSIAGTRVDLGDEVNVCTWLIHRDPRYWDRPDDFEPQRWADVRGNPAYLPFGFGPHACVGAGLSLRLLADLVRLVTAQEGMSVHPVGGGAHIGPALAPPPFEIRCEMAAATVAKGGERTWRRSTER